MNARQQSDAPRAAQRDKAPLFTALVTAPFSTITAIVALIFGLATLVGGLSALGGIVYAIAAPFFAGRTGVAGVFVQIGAGLSAGGLGLMVFSVFLLLTRSIVTRWIRLLRYVNGR